MTACEEVQRLLPAIKTGNLPIKEMLKIHAARNAEPMKRDATNEDKA